jgi:hypothetical protein
MNLPPNLACRLLSEEFGIERSPATLAKLRCIGGGPQFLKARRAVIYPEDALREWARSMLSPPMRNTQDAGSRAA